MLGYEHWAAQEYPWRASALGPALVGVHQTNAGFETSGQLLRDLRHNVYTKRPTPPTIYTRRHDDDALVPLLLSSFRGLVSLWAGPSFL